LKVVQGPRGREYRYANVVQSGDIVDVTYHLYKHKQGIQNIGNGEYMVLATGEIKEYQRDGETKADTLDLVKQSVRELVRTINANAGNVREKGLWFTLTYTENVRDLGRVYSDLQAFWRRIRKKYGAVEYIVVLEPQARGAWHTHILAWLPVGQLYIPKQDLIDLWGQCQIVNIQRVKDVDNIGAYLSAYLTNIREGKETKKGARLHLYPKGMRIWRCSRGVTRPVVENWKPPGYVRSVAGTCTPCYAPPPIDLYGDDGRLLDSVLHLQYNMKRPNGV
jgi:hypothetical protein